MFDCDEVETVNIAMIVQPSSKCRRSRLLLWGEELTSEFIREQEAQPNGDFWQDERKGHGHEGNPYQPKLHFE